MSINRGKQFETKFKEDWEKTVPNSFILRLYDQMNGNKFTSANPCDFICFKFPRLYLFECKSHGGKSFPFTSLPQYEKLIHYNCIFGVHSFVILWFYDCDVVYAIPILTIQKMIEDGKKSISIKDIDTYNMIKIPSIKKRVFMDSDYKILVRRKRYGRKL